MTFDGVGNASVEPDRPLRILVADDSEENRFLIAEYLKSLDPQIEFAENGLIAVEKFCSGVYNLVLLDLRMPVMDGYAVIGKIRAFEKQAGRQVTPVIALTASALEAEVQKALDAGCTAYLQKPVRLQTMVETVRKYASVPRPNIQSGADAVLRAIRPEYLDHRRADVRNILLALDRADYESIRDCGHKMSGTGGSYGFPRITQIGAAIEKAAREGHAEEIRLLVEELLSITST